jgi:hypothetical protein
MCSAVSKAACRARRHAALIPLPGLKRGFEPAGVPGAKQIGTSPRHRRTGRSASAVITLNARRAYLLCCSAPTALQHEFLYKNQPERGRKTMIIINALRFIRTIWTEARQLEVETLRQYSHLRGE